MALSRRSGAVTAAGRVFDPSRGYGAWMRRIATHVAIDLLKASHRSSSMPIESIAGTPFEVDGAGGAGRQALVAAIAQAFDLLPPKLRVVATLALIEECPHAEIAEALDVPIGTVKSRLFRATQKLRSVLEPLEEKR
jgi:RNA polymerase sigma-70 factor (ECF subfamily)